MCAPPLRAALLVALVVIVYSCVATVVSAAPPRARADVRVSDELPEDEQALATTVRHLKNNFYLIQTKIF
jgi:hypothetical protein